MIDRRDRLLSRSVALVLLAALLAAPVVFVGLPLVSQYEDAVSALAVQRTQLARLQAAKLEQPVLQGRLKSLKQQFADGTALFHQGTPDTAAVRLQQIVGDLVRAKGGQVRMARVLPRPVSNGPSRASAALTFAMSNDALMALLREVDGLRPVTLLDAMTVKSDHGAGARRQTAGSEPVAIPFRDDPTLVVEIQVSAFVRNETAP